VGGNVHFKNTTKWLAKFNDNVYNNQNSNEGLNRKSLLFHVKARFDPPGCATWQGNR